jgi:hypothetical protein
MRVEPACASVVRALAGHSATMILDSATNCYDEINSDRGGATIRCCHPLVSCRLLLTHPERSPLQTLKTRRRSA